ncbi:MAG: VacB/RNase II family 3'-5' exoribonuclease [Spirochaetota bacterium]
MTIEQLIDFARRHKVVKKHLLVKHFHIAERDYPSVQRVIDEAAAKGILMRGKKKGVYKLSRTAEKMQEKRADVRRGTSREGGFRGGAGRDRMDRGDRGAFRSYIGMAKDDAKYIVIKHGLPRGWNAKADAELQLVPKEVPAGDLTTREDLRNYDIVTIDGEDAKDFDDAINVTRTPDGFELGVHIADVSHFIRKGSALDKEAKKRANSFYLIDTVVPMFPFPVSNGICSLNPNTPRLTMSAFMKIDNAGNIVSYRFAESVIQSKRRMTYTGVQKILDKEENADPWLTKLLTDSHALMNVLKSKRMNEGSIDFDFDEIKITLDEKGEPVSFSPKPRLDAHRIVEECMLAANRVVAEYLGKHTESLYRVHGTPDEEKLANFERIAHNRGYALNRDPKTGEADFKSFRASMKGKPDEELLLTLLLRSMKQAYYGIENIGHYGLGFDYYTHFTSPIRRYSDLVIHRILRKIIRGQGKLSESEIVELAAVADHCSKQERIAVDAERELAKIKGARFLKGKVGLEYDGIITGVTAFGIFVRISEFGAEGLVRYQDLAGDRFHFNEADHSIVGTGGKRSYMLGDRVRVLVARVNIERLHVDLMLVESPRK